MSANQFSTIDYEMMQRALHLAQKGRFTTPPNPNVGCVITRDRQIIGQGFHIQAGGPHAEVHALRQAGPEALGATAYVTLEPCSHQGRTPPCAQALIDAKVGRVVCAMVDPNPQVAGKGIAALRAAGIQVDVGLMANEATAINRPFIKKMQGGLPFVQLKLAASLDGRTALANGESKWITAASARSDVQMYRAQADAILSTSQTVLTDNASLTVRPLELPTQIQQHYPLDQIRQPKRVILDRQHRLISVKQPLKLFETAERPILISTQPCTSPLVEPLLVDAKADKLDLRQTLQRLAQNHHIQHIWVEAGATLAANLIKENLVDELILYLAPKFIGADGRALINLLGCEKMDDILDLQIQDVQCIGADIRITARVNYKDNSAFA